MATDSENTNNNPSESLAANSRAITPPITNNIIGLTYGIPYAPNAADQSPLSPNGLVFPTPGMSNGYSSRLNGITDFTAYNDYIHYAPIAGANNKRFNVYSSLRRATQRFEIYSRQYRT